MGHLRLYFLLNPIISHLGGPLENNNQSLNWTPINQEYAKDEEFMTSLRESSVTNIRRKSSCRSRDRYLRRARGESMTKQRKQGVHQFSLACDSLTVSRNQSRSGARKLSSIKY